MNILQRIKRFLALPGPEHRPTATPNTTAAFNASAHEAYLFNNRVAIETESQGFVNNYGDFNTFLYRADFDIFMRKEVLFFRRPADENKGFLDNNHWQERHPFNFPGPFYTGQSDTCGTGVVEAPDNVMNDSYCCEYVFKQPKNFLELLQVRDAAAVEVFDSYSSNGNDHWTYEACKAWWKNKDNLLLDLQRLEIVQMNNGQEHQYIDYLNGDAELDLQRYCHFLLHGSYPAADTVLPIL